MRFMNKHVRFVWVLGAFLLAPSGVCSDTAEGAVGRVEAGKLSFTVPDGWTREQPTSPMRKAQFRVPAVNEDGDAASLILYYFGPGQGGSVEANLKRWEQQFEIPQGTTLAEVKKVEQKTIAGLNVTTLEMAGTYITPRTPINPHDRYNEPNSRLFAAVVETPDGNFFFKVVGPDSTMNQWRTDFLRMIDSLKWGDSVGPVSSH